MRAIASLSGGWRIGSFRYGMKYATNRYQVLKSFLTKNQDYWLNTPYGMFHCPDIASAWQFSVGWEKQVRILIDSLRDSLFLDVGANIGFYSVMAGKNGNRVIALEPNKSAFACLSDNLVVNCNQDTKAHNFAGWSTNEILKIHTKGYSDVSEISASGTEVQGMKLDTLLDTQIPNLVKIDAEGSEAEIFRGMTYTLEHAKAMQVIFEALNEVRLTECRKILFASGYYIVPIDGQNYLARRPLNND